MSERFQLGEAAVDRLIVQIGSAVSMRSLLGAYGGVSPRTHAMSCRWLIRST